MSECFTSSFEKAASAAFEEVYDELGNKMNLSPAVIVVDLSNFCLTFSEDHAKVFKTSMILADIGLHQLAKKFKNIVPED